MRGHITTGTLQQAHCRGHSAADALRVQQSRACHYAPPGFKKLSEKELVQTQLRIARLTSLLSKLRVGRQVLRTGTGRERNTQNENKRRNNQQNHPQQLEVTGSQQQQGSQKNNSSSAHCGNSGSLHGSPRRGIKNLVSSRTAGR